MTSGDQAGPCILGTVRTADGKGAVRIEDRLDTDIDDVWSALTDPARLSRWLGEFEGDLRLGGEYRARYHASGWEGTGRIVECEPPRRLALVSASPEEPGDEHVTEVTLTADGDRTVLTLEERGMPVRLVAAYGAGNQIQIEDLAAHLAGRERCDARQRWLQLQPGYAEREANGL